MLHSLLLREWTLNRRVTLISFGIFGVFQVYTVLNNDSPRSWMIFATIYASFLASVIYLREDKFRATAWSCALPVTRLEIVRARFIGSWIAVLLALVAALGIVAFVPGSKVSVAGILEPSTLLIAGSVVTFVLVFMLPFTMRFGFLGVMIFLVGSQVLAVVVLLLTVVLRRGRSDKSGPIGAVFSTVTDGVLALRDGLSPGLFSVLAVVFLILVNWAGYRLAVFLFQRREL